MLLDVVSLFENQERQSAWEAYCGAVAAGVERKKPFVLRFASLGLLGRETLSGPVLFKVNVGVLARAGLATRCKPAKEVKGKNFAKEEKNGGEPYAKHMPAAEAPLILALVEETIDRLAEILRSRHTLALAFPGIGRLTFASDRRAYSFLERRWEPLTYVTGRDALDPEDTVEGADTEVKNAPGFSLQKGNTLVYPPKQEGDSGGVSDLSSVDGDAYKVRGEAAWAKDPSWRPLSDTEGD